MIREDGGTLIIPHFPLSSPIFPLFPLTNLLYHCIFRDNKPWEGDMFKRVYAVLVIFAAIVLALPAVVFSIEKADKDAILQELSGFVDKNPDILRNVIFQMADDYSRQNKVDEAIALYERGLKAIPDNEDLMNRLANI